jgi:hypothetical protein
MTPLDLASIDDLLAELERRCPAFVFCACTPRDGEPNCMGYKYHTFGNFATKRGLAAMIDEYMEDLCRKNWVSDSDSQGD